MKGFHPLGRVCSLGIGSRPGHIAEVRFLTGLLVAL